MTALENKKNTKKGELKKIEKFILFIVYKGKTYLDPLRSPNQNGYDYYEYNSEN